jgi:cell fate (sporulation/competence/biofilm development) regulator YmcA (YheA/YmcA/DUF963 family)
MVTTRIDEILKLQKKAVLLKNIISESTANQFFLSTNYHKFVHI